MELICAVKNYHWGRIGSSSTVATLKKCSDEGYRISEDTPYAELWMGTHLNGQSIVKSENITLDQWIKNNPSCLGTGVINKFGNNLPFLFKVLSINMPLSIQVHPSKIIAEELNKKFPDVYKDDNHKPEMAVALSNFEALCGFRPISEIKNFISLLPELKTVIRTELLTTLLTADKDYEILLKECIRCLMTASKDLVSVQLKKLLSRLSTLDENTRCTLLAEELESIYSYYPDDVGCLSIYLFNYIKLKPNEAIFLKANVPHAYIKGDCIECMACSDNTIRAGLTPKFIDVETLVKIVDTTCEEASKNFLEEKIENESSVLYKPPFIEFAVVKIEIGAGCTYKMLPRSSASICVVINGRASLNNTSVNKGTVFFLSSDEIQTINVDSNSNNFLMFQAFANID